MFSKVNPTSLAFMSQAKRHTPASAHELTSESLKDRSLLAPSIECAKASAIDKVEIALGSFEPQISPRSKRMLEESSAPSVSVSPQEDRAERVGSGGGRATQAGDDGRPVSGGRPVSARLQARQQHQQVTITSMPGFEQRRSQRQAIKKQAEGAQ